MTRLLVKNEKPRRLSSELVLPLFVCVVGGFLLLMPSLTVFAKLAWVQGMGYEWGSSVLLIGLVLLAFTWYQRQLSVFAVSISIVLARRMEYSYLTSVNTCRALLKVNQRSRCLCL
jgi:hypothetical protein